jgi:hypothetical protein
MDISGTAMGYVLRRHAFLLFGLLTLTVFFIVEVAAKLGYNDLADTLAVPMRVLIIPMYIVWLLLTMAHVAIFGPAALSLLFAIVVYGIHLTACFLPYLLAD